MRSREDGSQLHSTPWSTNFVDGIKAERENQRDAA
jgi:hypothetical protein